jgi:hypothetical protein
MLEMNRGAQYINRWDVGEMPAHPEQLRLKIADVIKVSQGSL